MATTLEELMEAAMKIGARNNAGDKKSIQTMHDMLCEMGAECDAANMPGAKAISKREDVNPKEGTAQYGDVSFADEKNKKYPIDTEAHIRSAWNYINQEGNASKYDPSEVSTIKNKIVAAWKEKIDKAGPPSAKSLDLTYVKSLGLVIPDDELIDKLAIKSIGKDDIQGYTFIWGHPEKRDVEMEYFDRNTNFWDAQLKNYTRPLTWDHAQDETMKSSPIIGQINEFGDDEVGRWYTAHLDRAHRYRKAIDRMIEQGLLGSSSDTALQYARRESKGAATYIAEWPWFASALTDVPAEPRTVGTLDYFKSLGISIPLPDAAGNRQDANADQTRKQVETLLAKRQSLNLFME